jgi:hypothetical protein
MCDCALVIPPLFLFAEGIEQSLRQHDMEKWLKKTSELTGISQRLENRDALFRNAGNCRVGFLL